MAKILSLVPYPIFPANFGGQRAIALFNEYLARECDLVCVTVASNQPQYAKGYRLFNILSGSVLRYVNIFSFFTLRKIIRRHQVTHIILEHPYFGWLGMLLKTFTGVQLVIRSHNIESLRWKNLGKWWWKMLWWYERATHRAAHYNLFITDQDKDYALREFRLQPASCTTITYGIEVNHAPLPEEKAYCKTILKEHHPIGQQDTIFLFNGALGYLPNYLGVQAIVQYINPLLLKQDFPYKIIICGKGLPAGMNELKEYAQLNIIYAGFVDDIELYFKGADTFLNPVTEGGGIKTKLVEALGYNLNAVSTENGAFGVEAALTNNKLVITGNSDWASFAEAAKSISRNPNSMPQGFYDHFYWGSIANKAARFIGAYNTL
jgi:hypothetical protein